MSSTIYTNFLTAQDVASILDYYSSKPNANTEKNIVNKNLEYHIPNNFIYKLLYPKLSNILGPNHDFDGGAYKECHVAYPLHVDTSTAHYEVGSMSLSLQEKKHDLSILIPLDEGTYFKTVTFNIFSEDNHTDLIEYAQYENDLIAEDFTHDNFDLIRKLPVDIEFQWKLGDMLVWPRTQWHASTNFASYGLVKKFLILFIK